MLTGCDGGSGIGIGISASLRPSADFGCCALDGFAGSEVVVFGCCAITVVATNRNVALQAIILFNMCLLRSVRGTGSQDRFQSPQSVRAAEFRFAVSRAIATLLERPRWRRSIQAAPARSSAAPAAEIRTSRHECDVARSSGARCARQELEQVSRPTVLSATLARGARCR